MKFALVVREGRSSAADFADELRSAISEAGASVAGVDEAPDMVLAVGGDGTMLGAVALGLAHDVPVLGFNLGTMGFLTAADPALVGDAVASVVSGDYTVTDRMTVSATMNGRTTTGVNDVVVEKVDSQRLAEMDVFIDGAEFVTYRADGIIIATPTGSTAYSFSAGGPLVDHQLEALILTPVAAHSLFDRSIVLPASAEIEVRVVRDRSVHVTVDKADLGHMAAGESVSVTRGDRPSRFVALEEHPFVGLVKSKFSLR